MSHFLDITAFNFKKSQNEIMFLAFRNVMVFWFGLVLLFSQMQYSVMKNFALHELAFCGSFPLMFPTSFLLEIFLGIYIQPSLQFTLATQH